MRSPTERVLEAVERCDDCDGIGDKCEEHEVKYQEAQRVEDMRTDPQRNRIGVRGDPTPDAHYGR